MNADRMLWQIELHGSDRALTNGRVYAVPEVDMNIVIKDKEPRSQTLTCTCPRVGHFYFVFLCLQC